GVRVDAVPLLQDERFRAIAERYLGRPIEIDILRELVAETIAFARQVKFPATDAVVPEQEVIGGTLQVLVTVARLGVVEVQGNEWFATNQLSGAIRIKPGEPIDGATLDADLAWLNSNPFRSIDAVLRQGQQPGTSDIILRTNDRFPVRFFGGYANDGTRATDRDRLSSGFSWGDAFRLGHRLDYQYSRSIERSAFQGHSGSYAVPLPWRDILTLSGGYTRTRSQALGAFSNRGEGRQFAARYSVPLPRLEVANGLTHEVSFGAEYKRNNSDLEFGGVNVFSSAPEINHGVLSYVVGLLDQLGSTTASVDAYYSPGDLTSNNTTAAFRQARFGADARYAYVRARVERVFFLPDEFTFVARGAAQWANRNLLFSERLPVGGARSVRGYEEDAFSGDLGYVATLELRTPSIAVLPLFGVSEPNDQLQFLAFFDYGVASPFQRAPGGPGRQTAASVGVGLRYSIGPYLALRVDHGVQLRGDNPLASRDRDQRTHVGVIVGY
ncbi:MAG TPA: ShlB/FhaC/HecB family hemolysin secretion/activation protein, partial [Alphaproteobacteria bacterium]|nr:ShlB/FhaC/HecB family hemolysin secretion/activation protein [Alphaproteobacteria bacterium]